MCKKDSDCPSGKVCIPGGFSSSSCGNKPVVPEATANKSICTKDSDCPSGKKCLSVMGLS